MFDINVVERLSVRGNKYIVFTTSLGTRRHALRTKYEVKRTVIIMQYILITRGQVDTINDIINCVVN